MYECTYNTIKILKNKFMTCHLIFNVRPTFFHTFEKKTAISISHNVKKLGDKNFWSKSGSSP